MPRIRRGIIRWRFSGGLTKSILGFWAKASIEIGIIIGVPVAGLIIVATEAVGISVGTLPQVPESSHPRILAWAVLSIAPWLQSLRCMLATGIQINDQQAAQSSQQQNQQ